MLLPPPLSLSLSLSLSPLPKRVIVVICQCVERSLGLRHNTQKTFKINFVHLIGANAFTKQWQKTLVILRVLKRTQPSASWTRVRYFTLVSFYTLHSDGAQEGLKKTWGEFSRASAHESSPTDQQFQRHFLLFKRRALADALMKHSAHYT